ncbi:MAG: hypothetical protein ACTSSJ_00400 [Candidatus Odinarchaeia archaeon]
MSSNNKEVQWGSIFKYMGIGFDIIVFAVIGYFIAKYLNWNEILGIMAGALFGTLIMYIHLLYVAGVIRKKEKKESEEEGE